MKIFIPTKVRLFYINLPTVFGDEKDMDEEFIDYLRKNNITTIYKNNIDRYTGLYVITYIGPKNSLIKMIKGPFSSGDNTDDRNMIMKIRPIDSDFMIQNKDNHDIEKLFQKEKYHHE